MAFEEEREVSPADEAAIRAALEAVGISCSLEIALGRGRPAFVTLAIEMRAISLSDKILRDLADCKDADRGMAAIAEAVASTFVAECTGGKKPRAQGSGAASAWRTLSRYGMTTPV
jgi:hypothetical protein